MSPKTLCVVITLFVRLSVKKIHIKNAYAYDTPGSYDLSTLDSAYIKLKQCNLIL